MGKKLTNAVATLPDSIEQDEYRAEMEHVSDESENIHFSYYYIKLF